MNRYLKKRHNHNRFNYYYLTLYILAPKVLLISSFLLGLILKVDPHRVIFSVLFFYCSIFFLSFITLITLCIWWSKLCLPTSALRWNHLCVEYFMIFSIFTSFKKYLLIVFEIIRCKYLKERS